MKKAAAGGGSGLAALRRSASGRGRWPCASGAGCVFGFLGVFGLAGQSAVQGVEQDGDSAIFSFLVIVCLGFVCHIYWKNLPNLSLRYI